MDLTKYIMSRPLNRILAMILLVLIGSACSSGIAAESAVFVAPGGNSNEKHVLLKAPEGATLTPTPFQPLPPTPTYIPHAQPGASGISHTEIPPRSHPHLNCWIPAVFPNPTPH